MKTVFLVLVPSSMQANESLLQSQDWVMIAIGRAPHAVPTQTLTTAAAYRLSSSHAQTGTASPAPAVFLISYCQRDLVATIDQRIVALCIPVFANFDQMDGYRSPFHAPHCSPYASVQSRGRIHTCSHQPATRRPRCRAYHCSTVRVPWASLGAWR